MRLSKWMLPLLTFATLWVTALSEPQTEKESNAEPKVESKSNDFLGPSGGQLGIGGEQGWGLGTAVGDPTALYGPTRSPITLFGTDRESLIDLQGYYLHKFDEEHRMLVEGHIDPAFTGIDVSYSISPKSWDGAVTMNGWVSTGNFAPYDISGFEVKLAPDREPKVQSLGFGVEYIQPFTEDLDVAFGANYAQYAFADDFLGGSRRPLDRNGFPLTASGVAATERFVGLRINGLYSSFNDRDLPTAGTKIRFGTEQGLAIAEASTSFNRLEANIAHLISMPGFNEGEHTLLLNLQAGTILGSPPPTRAFHLGGAASVRGYEPGELASGKSFLQGTAEYRHHLNTFRIMDDDVTARLAVFYDYASSLGTSDELKGTPPQLQNKLGQGYGYGLGLHLASKYGLFRLESAWNAQGANGFFLSVGERF